MLSLDIHIIQFNIIQITILFTNFNWDYDVYNDAKNNEDLIKIAFHCVEVLLQNIYLGLPKQWALKISSIIGFPLSLWRFPF